MLKHTTIIGENLNKTSESIEKSQNTHVIQSKKKYYNNEETVKIPIFTRQKPDYYCHKINRLRELIT